MKLLNDDPETLAQAHWSYVASILKAHGESEEVIEKCGHHYITAFVHGWKHAKEDVEELFPGTMDALMKLGNDQASGARSVQLDAPVGRK